MRSYSIAENSEGRFELNMNNDGRNQWILPLIMLPIIIYFLIKTDFYLPFVLISLFSLLLSFGIAFWVYSSSPIVVTIDSNNVVLKYRRPFVSYKTENIMKEQIARIGLSVTRWGDKRRGYQFNGCVEIVERGDKKTTIYSSQYQEEQLTVDDIKMVSSTVATILNVPKDENVVVKK